MLSNLSFVSATSIAPLLRMLAFAQFPLFSSAWSPSNWFSQGQDSSNDNLLSSHFGLYGWPGQKFDYIIAGGGTAGLAMANRLAANGSVSVAVIEAGGFHEVDSGNATDVPMWLFNYLYGPAKNPLFDWYQYTTPQGGLADRSMFYVAGKTLGGSTARNAMLYQRYLSSRSGSDSRTSRLMLVRGSKGAYQKWADQVGDDSYTFENFLPYFQKGVDFSPPSMNARPANASAISDASVFSTSGGPLQVAYPYWVNSISSWVGLAMKSLGISEAAGFSDGNLLGSSYITQTISPRTRTRETASTSYLREALMQTNKLNVFKSTLVKKILFDEKNKANGVLVNTGGFEYQISATKEVILSAGVMRSPQLLMVSGIGPRQTLEELGIPVRAERPGVGQNMWDAIIFGPTYPVNVQSHSQLLGSRTFLAQSIEEYNTKRTGPLTNPGQDYFAFEKLVPGTVSAATEADVAAAFPSDWPTFAYIALDDTFVPQFDGKNYFSMSASLVAPFSRGTVTINSTDTAQNPVVDPRWLDDPRDQELVVAAWRRCRQIVATDAFKPVLAGPELLPGANVTSDEAILKYIAETADAFYAGAGTCAMGRADDPNAVVDSKARVIGVDGLRVVDASAFPFGLDGQPMATVYALAEKIAAEILNGD
ncbi:hypothetical protein H2201_006901 [Coniosporium apollinis]|uniref:Glucose-methanol-choline oxidoreductase N-terminal domain-containing protein n=1 Tax=Coniosporium apollinis TaxID=61459 RepID=A0ABQ9NKG8_9PEZI|nr:hypothetical protein H2201_006901 [Coniosporium apollinis]